VTRHQLPRRLAWFVFGVLVLLMIVIRGRQIVVSMFPHLKAEWDLSDRQLGSLVSIVSIVVALGTVPLSLLADRWSRVKSIVLMALVWSVATIACAFARDYNHLLVARGFVGLGEAAYGSAGAALLASIFPAKLRSTVLGAFLGAGLVGSVLGVVLGGVIAEHWLAAAFGVVGIPGLVLPRWSGWSCATKAPWQPWRRSPAGTPARWSANCCGADGGYTCRRGTATWSSQRKGLMPSFSTCYYGLAPDQAGLKTGSWCSWAPSVRSPGVSSRIACHGAMPGRLRCRSSSLAHGGSWGRPSLRRPPAQLARSAGATVMTGTIASRQSWSTSSNPTCAQRPRQCCR
jgi:MFS family permease